MYVCTGAEPPKRAISLREPARFRRQSVHYQVLRNVLIIRQADRDIGLPGHRSSTVMRMGVTGQLDGCRSDITGTASNSVGVMLQPL
jgi:hypothetical protein